MWLVLDELPGAMSINEYSVLHILSDSDLNTWVKDEYMNRWMDGWRDGGMDGGMDGRMDNEPMDGKDGGHSEPAKVLESW